jgi:hypothetical protein
MPKSNDPLYEFLNARQKDYVVVFHLQRSFPMPQLPCLSTLIDLSSNFYNHKLPFFLDNLLNS